MEEVRQRSGHILQKDNCRLGLDHDPSNVRPEVALVLLTPALAGGAEGLAREPRSHAIHDATPCDAVEAGEVPPEGSAIQDSIRHPGEKDILREPLNLDVADRPVRRDGELEAEVKARRCLSTGSGRSSASPKVKDNIVISHMTAPSASVSPAAAPSRGMPVSARSR